MKTFDNYKMVKCRNLIFNIREGTSDIKAIREVVERQSYKKRNFFPTAGETWIDIGANCGAFCVWAASFGAKVLAFEPDPENAAIARTNIEVNGLADLIKLHEVGLTAEDEEQQKALHRNTANGNLWRNSLHKQWRGGESISVKTIPVTPYWTSQSCIKLDAEGVEMPILERFAEIKVKKLVFEWSFDIDPSISRFEKVISKLKKQYKNVAYASFKPGYENWQPSWFPACRTVWCF